MAQPISGQSTRSDAPVKTARILALVALTVGLRPKARAAGYEDPEYESVTCYLDTDSDGERDDCSDGDTFTRSCPAGYTASTECEGAEDGVTYYADCDQDGYGGDATTGCTADEEGILRDADSCECVGTSADSDDTCNPEDGSRTAVRQCNLARKTNPGAPDAPWSTTDWDGDGLKGDQETKPCGITDLTADDVKKIAYVIPNASYGDDKGSYSVFTTVEEAVYAAERSRLSGGYGVVCVASGTYTPELTIDGKVMIYGDDHSDNNESTVAFEGTDGSRQWRPITVEDSADVVLGRLTVENGYSAENGGAISITGATVTLEDIEVLASSAANGGGIAIAASQHDFNVTLDGVLLRENQAMANGGGIYATGGGNLEAASPLVAFSNDAGSSGGAVALKSVDSATLMGTFSGNSATTGGAIYASSVAGLDILSSVFVSSLATGSGGAIYLYDSAPEISSTTFTGNMADSDGGAIYASRSDVFLSGDLFDGNFARSEGGAIYFDAIVSYGFPFTVFQGEMEVIDDHIPFGLKDGIERVPLARARRKSIYIPLELADLVRVWPDFGYHTVEYDNLLDVGSDCQFVENSTEDGSGGALYLEGGSANITSSGFESNYSTSGSGGAIYAFDADVDARKTWWYLNYTGESSSYGGAIYADSASQLTVKNACLQENTAATEGGAIALGTFDGQTIEDTYFYDNEPHDLYEVESRTHMYGDTFGDDSNKALLCH